MVHYHLQPQVDAAAWGRRRPARARGRPCARPPHDRAEFWPTFPKTATEPKQYSGPMFRILLLQLYANWGCLDVGLVSGGVWLAASVQHATAWLPSRRHTLQALVWILTETAIVAAIVLPMQNLATGVAAVSCATKHVWSPLFLVRVTSDVWMLIRDKHELIIKLIP